MRTKMILFMGVCLLAFAFTPLRKALAGLEKCHSDAGCTSGCNRVPAGGYEQCRQEYAQAAKNSSGQGVPNTGTNCGIKYAGGSDCSTSQHSQCGGYSWEADACDSS